MHWPRWIKSPYMGTPLLHVGTPFFYSINPYSSWLSHNFHLKAFYYTVGTKLFIFLLLFLIFLLLFLLFLLLLSCIFFLFCKPKFPTFLSLWMRVSLSSLAYFPFFPLSYYLLFSIFHYPNHFFSRFPAFFAFAQTTATPRRLIRQIQISPPRPRNRSTNRQFWPRLSKPFSFKKTDTFT